MNIDTLSHTLQHPIINAAEHVFGGRLYLMWAGAHGGTRGYVWADSDESAFEVWVEYLDDEKPGLLVSYEEFRELLNAAAQEAGFSDFDAVPEDKRDAITEAAEVDLAVIGHTSMKHGMHIASYEWGFDEVPEGEAEYDAVKEASEALDVA